MVAAQASHITLHKKRQKVLSVTRDCLTLPGRYSKSKSSARLAPKADATEGMRPAVQQAIQAVPVQDTQLLSGIAGRKRLEWPVTRGSKPSEASSKFYGTLATRQHRKS